MTLSPRSPIAAAEFPARPASVAEWEDVLFRFELMPRLLNNALDEAAGAVEGDLREQLGELNAREEAALRFIGALARDSLVPTLLATGGDGSERPGAWREALVSRFRKLRARSFASLQRRGLEVWEWAAEHPSYGRVSAYQLLRALTNEDARLLARLRERSRAERQPC